MLPSAATATGSDEDKDEEEDVGEEGGPVIPQDRIGSISSDVLSGATNQLLQVRTLHARLKSQKQLAEESRQRASAQKLEEKRQADLIARVKLEAWAKNLFAAMDQNKDGGLTLKELKDGLELSDKICIQDNYGEAQAHVYILGCRQYISKMFDRQNKDISQDLKKTSTIRARNSRRFKTQRSS